MKTINVDAFLSTELDASLKAARTIEIEDTPLGQGGFGIAYRALGIDGHPVTPQVIKLLTGNGSISARRGFDTVQELQRRLRAEHAQLSSSSGRGLLDQFPALRGVPQLSFEGRLDRQIVLGYSAHDLTRSGFQEFGRILEDDSQLRAFQALPIAAKMRIAAQLVGTFDYLSSRIRFIHADMKAEALFVDVSGLRCAIIDFDSGALARDASDTPTTFGTRQDWLAPEIVRQLDAPGNASRSVQVNLLSDVWSINVAIHYMFFSFHPLFFLKEISDRSIDAYFRRFAWPDADTSFQYFRKEYAAVHAQYLRWLKSMPADIVQRFAFTINQGFRNPSARTTYGQWKTVLTSLNRPAIRRFTADRTFVNDSHPVRLAWDVTGAARLELRGIGDVTSRTAVDVTVRRDTDFELVLTPDAGAPIAKRLRVEVDKRPPSIKAFTTSNALLTRPTPARLSWSASGAERVELDNGIGDVTGRSSIDVLPRGDTRFTLTATSPFGVQTVATVDIRVSSTPPEIISFRSDTPYLTNGEPVSLSWEVSPDAESIVLAGCGPVNHRGRIELDQRRNTEYVLTATNYFGKSASTRIQVLVSGAPPVIRDFRINPSAAAEGMEVALTWNVTGAERVSIEPGLGLVPVHGAHPLRANGDQEFILRAESPYGVVATKRARLRCLMVRPPVPVPKLREAPALRRSVALRR